MPDITEYTKPCPKCGSIQRYGTKYDLQKAINKNALCRSCSRDRRDKLYYEGLKVCSVCKETKPLTEFPKAAKGIGGLKAHCISCNRLLNKARWQRRGKEGAKKTEQYRVAKIKEYISLKKSVPCADCKQTFPSVCMDFDHLPEFEKSASIAELVRRKASIEKIDVEIAKCEVVCANCHRLRTSSRFKEKKTLEMQKYTEMLEEITKHEDLYCDK